MKVQVIILVLCIVLVSCHSSREAKKDTAAYERVINKKTLADKTFAELEKSRPCINDTVTKIIPGATIVKSDTQLIEVPVYRVDSFETVTPVIKWKERVITNTVSRTDTLRLTVEDVRRLNLAKDSLNYWKGLYQQKKAEASEANKAKNKAVLYMWLLLLLIALFIGISIYKKVSWKGLISKA